jgi:hypothetical protein
MSDPSPKPTNPMWFGVKVFLATLTIVGVYDQTFAADPVEIGSAVVLDKTECWENEG